ncbi:MAG TPA: HD domain-containing phosphohydrolase [Polyangiales bacterium]|nr:HD domain-containing phosphohydrolase [Polyangiales bacterium]
MSSSARFRLAELLGGLSLACDLADGFAPGTVLRVCLLTAELARRSGLANRDIYDAYYVSLLRYLGCTAFSHEEAHIYGAGDDIALRRTMSLADVAAPGTTLRRVIAGIGPGRSLPQRMAAVARLLGDGKALQDHTRSQCDVSVRMAELVRLGPRVRGALRQVCERWDGKGTPAGLAGGELDVVARLNQLTDVVAITWQEAGPDAALASVRSKSARHLDPELCRTFLEHAPELFALLDEVDLWQRFLDAEPEPRAHAEGAHATDALRAFAYFADMKSVYTLGHSPAVAALAEQAARAAGLDGEVVASLSQAALLHDLGRVALPNAIWDKPAKLSVAELEAVRLHAYYTERVLFRAPALRELAPLAAASHERCDGAGYHRGLPSSLQPMAARILAASDVYCALREPRAHRPAFEQHAACDTLQGEVRAGRLDPGAVRAVLEAAAGRTSPAISGEWPSGLSDREVEVLRLLARGGSNKQIGAQLSISAKTVQHHVAHVYAKIGVSSRAAAALFATEHGLL